jgi:hypothetical protein
MVTCIVCLTKKGQNQCHLVRDAILACTSYMQLVQLQEIGGVRHDEFWQEVEEEPA